MRFLAAVFLVLFLLPAAASADQLQDGQAAYDRRDCKTASKLWQPLADQGNAEAQDYIGQMYIFPCDVKPDNREALKWLHKAADQGYMPAQSQIGLIYRSGQGVKQDYAESLKWLHKAADKGSASAQFALGGAYYFSLGVKQDYREAYFWYSVAAKAGDEFRPGPLDDAKKHLTSEELEKVEKRLAIWQASPDPTPLWNLIQKHKQQWKLLATPADSPKVLLDRGDYQAALKLLQPLATQGDAKAEYQLGEMFEFGWGVKRDDSEAMKWYDNLQKKAEEGDTEAENEIGSLYANEMGVTPRLLKEDSAEGIRWLRKAAEHGSAEAAGYLGYMYSSGFPVPRDGEQSNKWYRRAFEIRQVLAKQGDMAAQAALGNMYETGNGAPRDVKEAIKWYLKAAEQGDVSAQYKLGILFHGGQGEGRDDNEAAKWYARAAERGDWGAPLDLCALYELGVNGSEPDWQEAYFWGAISDHRNRGVTSLTCGDLTHVTPEQQTALDNRVVEWFKAHGYSPVPDSVAPPP